jgi:uncharacterized protein YifN (PemK superfamily)
MKKQLLQTSILAIFTLSFFVVSAQNILDPEPSQYKNNNTAYVSDPFIDTQLGDNRSNIYKINIRAVRNFKNTYPNSADEKWEILKDGYIASLVSNSVTTNIYYDKKGRWVYSVRNYNEKKLPESVRAMVKTTYFDYEITIIKEITMETNNAQPIYLVYIKYNTTYKIVRVYDMKMEVFTFEQ